MNRLIVSIGTAALLCACVTDNKETKDYTAYVNPFIGTGGHGHTFPGAVVPFGMIQPSPDTRIDGWDACSGYHYSDSLLNGFSQTHLSGTGCSDYGDFLLMPTVGPQTIDPQSSASQNMPYASEFDHSEETSEPGYYSTMLKRYGVKAEITAAPRSALYRFTFPATDDPGMIVDADYSISHQNNLAMTIEAVGDTAIRAYRLSRHWAYDQQLSMYAEFSKPFTCSIITDTVSDETGRVSARCKALLKFAPTKEGEEIYVKVGISAVDTEGAEKNLRAEIPGFDFDNIRDDARKSWNEYLSKIDVTADNDDDRTVFYTALYHTGISPNLFTDVDGRYFGMDRKIHQGDVDNPVYTVFSLWDTHRALHPLYTIIDPERNNDFINSLLTKYKEGGILPMWELAGNYTGCMTGYHAVSLMADAVNKGIADFDIAEALNAAERSSRYDTTATSAPDNVFHKMLMPRSKYYKNTLGYIPWNEEFESVTKGLEYAYNDWCISQLAEAAGDKAKAEEYAKKGQNYRNYFDPATRFMRGKDTEGNWHTPFNPRGSSHGSGDYCEGTAWQWTWFAPHDVDGLTELMGGRELFIERLDSLFNADSRLEGENVSADISGLIGQYAHGNEPSHHIIHLYNYAGRSDRTQELVDKVLKEQYRADTDGLSGNEDCGQMSAWYVLNSLGFYQVCPGKPVYSIGRPWFPHAEINLPNGKRVTLDVKNYSKDNKYITSVKLNGKELETPFFTHDDIVNGADFEITMSPEHL